MHKIAAQLESSRKDLLDLSLRNTLINYRPLKSRGVTIVGESPQELFRILVAEGKKMTFAPRRETGQQSPEQTEPDDPFLDPFLVEAETEAEQQRDNKLQTNHSELELQKLLLNTYYTARTYVEERGVNVLYLALGMLQWYESESSDLPRWSPLILLPVELQRTSIKAPFRLCYTEDDLGENLSLKAKLHTEFGIELPPMPDVGDLLVADYFDSVAHTIRQKANWRVDREAVALGFFSFATFLMYNDLEADNWSGEADLAQHPVMSALLGDGFSNGTGEDGFWQLSDDVLIDAYVRPQDSHQVVDADSSQILAVLGVNRGQNLVIQGPPGTGKSQTITNIIAEAIGAGKKVLFVAEKMAALEVVKRRLDQVGLGDACLELHSHKTNKKAVLAELKRTLDLGKPRTVDGTHDYQALAERQKELNAYSQAVNTPVSKSGVTPYVAYGRLLKLKKALHDTGTPELRLPDPVSWSLGEFQQKLAIADALQKLIQDAGRLREHPFWGSQYHSFLPQDGRRVAEAAQQAQEAITLLRQAAAGVDSRLASGPSQTLPDSHRASYAVRQITAAPNLTGVDSEANAWRFTAEAARTAVQSGARWEALRQEFGATLIPEAWKQDVLPLRKAYVAYGDKWWRVFSGEFRRAKKELAGLCQEALPKPVEAQMALIEAILESQRLETAVAEQESLLQTLFAGHWRGLASDWAYFTAVSDWLITAYEDVDNGRLPPTAIAYAATRPDRSDLQAAGSRLDQALTRYETAVAEAIAAAQIDEIARQRAAPAIRDLPLAEQEALFVGWETAVGRIQEMVTYNLTARQAKAAGLETLLEIALDWPAACDHLSHLMQRAWYEAIIAAAFAERPVLNSFNGATHEQKIESFRQLDHRHFDLNRQQLALQHWDNLPKQGNAGQLGILRREFEKKSRHLPIRKLMEQTGNAVQALKPVFMMGPLSIAMYLPPNALHFDLVVFDEASQVRPVDAFGAILRGGQAVVVGDSKQLPPTSFFDKMVDEEQEESVTSDLESILGVFAAQGAAEKMLRWHYRSRHESLITVSNYEFYDNKLVVFPSPAREDDHRGLVYHYLPHTHYDRGKSGANRLEAQAVAQAVLEHAQARPELSLGVAAFSLKQMQAIQDQVELLRGQNPSYEPFFAAHPEEPFFVKNLENVQGDERDVIFISVGYGRDQNGQLTMNFGPLNREGGERRLNVLITRAKQRCEVFTNLKADDIDLTKTKARGVLALKRYLKYAEDRTLDLPIATGREADSPFEEAVAGAIREMGYEVVHQVGSAGFFVDLAVKDPNRSGRYLLGVECDGATYHSARSARDRDRLRQLVLEGLGWKIHRIWSTDWFQNPTRQIEKLRAAIEKATLDQPVKAEAVTVATAVAASIVRTTIDRAAEPKTLPKPVALPYEIAPLQVRSQRQIPEMPTSQLVRYIVQVVEAESPVHEEDVISRIMEAAGARRRSSQILNSLENAINAAVREGNVRRKGAFLWRKEMLSLPHVRSRQALESPDLERVSPEEIALAVEITVNNAFGLREDELYGEVCALLGFSRVTPKRKQQLAQIVERMIRDGRLTHKGDFLQRP